MLDLKKYNCLVFDYGSYISVAERLAREDGFGKTYFFSPYVHNGYPDHRAQDIGRNVPDVIKVREWAEVINEVDVVVFCDAHEPALQSYFQSIGKKVFGAKYATELEHNRVRQKELLVEVGLPVNKYVAVTGMDELEAYLKSHDDLYVKSLLRGDLETFHHETYNLSKGELIRMRAGLGAYQNKPTYILETPIKDGLAEVGIDTFCINGEYPEDNLSGCEIKDTGYYGQIVKYKDLPRSLRLVTDKLSNTFRELSYTGAHSNEVIISKNMKGYLLDLTNRFAQPPTDLMLEMYENFPEIVWNVSNGIVPKIKYKHKHGIQLIIKSELAKTEPSPIIVPKEYRNNVKVKNLTIDDDGTYYYTPLDVPMCEIGSVVFTGNTMKEAVDGAKKVAESIKGFDIKINTDCISKAQEQINRLNQAGINYL